jgi:hypothetical protein
MSCGSPAIAPQHSGVRDYINKDTAFVIESSLEPSYWPHDPRVTLRTLCYRINFESMVDALHDSYKMVKSSPRKYRKMAMAASERLRMHCSAEVVEEALTLFLETHKRMQDPFSAHQPQAESRPGPWWRRL